VGSTVSRRLLADRRMAFNLGRPALFAGEETIRNAREFLKHPLSIRTDSRLVATCELLSGRGKCDRSPARHWGASSTLCALPFS